MDLAVVDVETTGVNPASDRVIEVAVVRVSREESSKNSPPSLIRKDDSPIASGA